MMIHTDNMISISEANQNFSKVAGLVDQTGQAVKHGILAVRQNLPKQSEKDTGTMGK